MVPSLLQEGCAIRLQSTEAQGSTQRDGAACLTQAVICVVLNEISFRWPLWIMNAGLRHVKVGVAFRFQLFLDVQGVDQQIRASDLIIIWHTEVLHVGQCTGCAGQGKLLNGWSHHWLSPVDGRASKVSFSDVTQGESIEEILRRRKLLRSWMRRKVKHIYRNVDDGQEEE